MKRSTLFLVVFYQMFNLITNGQNLPRIINYQSVLKDNSGNLVPNGYYVIAFNIYESETGGDALWTESKTINVLNGLLNTQLGSDIPLNLSFDVPYHLGVTVSPGNELIPRIRLTSVPYSIMSMNVLDGSISTSKLQDAAITIDKITENSINSSKVIDGSLQAIDLNSNQVVKSLNGMRDDVNLLQGDNITLQQFGSDIRISANSGMGGTVTQINTGEGLTGGPITNIGTISIANDGVSNVMIQNNSISSTKIVDGTITANDIGNSQVVKSLNNLKDEVNIIAGSNISITPSGNSLTINAMSSNGIIGSGVPNYLPIFLEATTLSNSLIYQNSGKLGIGTTTPTSLLEIGGSDIIVNSLTLGRGSGDKETNTTFGNQAIKLNTSGLHNSGFGYQALFSNLSGYHNVAIGLKSLFLNSVGDGNASLGNHALYSNTLGSYNVAVGKSSLYDNTVGSYNVAIGNSAGDSRTSLSYSTFVGSFAYSSVDNLSNASCFGYDSRTTANNQVRIGNSSVTSIGGYVGWSNISDSRYKVAVKDNIHGLEFIMRLRPVSYQLNLDKLAESLGEGYVPDESGTSIFKASETMQKARIEKIALRYTGFIAQEVELAAEQIGFEFSGIDKPQNPDDFYGLRYAEFVVPLVKAVQEQQQIITELKDRIKKLEQR